MFVANTGIQAMSFNEEGINTSGSLTKSIRRPPEMSFAREKSESTIAKIAADQNQPIGIIISKIFSQSVPELQSFVQARGETPSDDLKKLAIQAALLRATEIGMVSKQLDTDDSDALYKIEESEQQHVEDNTTATSSILPPDTSAALNLLVQRIASRHKQNSRSGKLRDFVADMKKASGASNFQDVSCRSVAASNLDGDEYLLEFEDNYGPIGGTTSTKGSFWDNLFSNIDKVVDGITKTAGAINTTVGNVQTTAGGIIDKATDIGGTIGAKSIEQYLRDNWVKVVVVVIVIILFTILISRAARRN